MIDICRRKANVRPIMVLIIATAVILSNSQKTVLQSTIKADTKYVSQHFKNVNLYSISLQRTSSVDQQQDQSCHTSPKQIVVKKQTEIYRLKSNSQQKREQTIFTKIRTLDDNQNIIQEFQKIGSEIFVLTTDGTGYFLPQNYTSIQDTQIVVKTGLNLTKSHEYFYNVIIIDYNERALIITPQQISLCRSQHKSCSKVQNYDGIQYLFNAKLYTIDGKNFIFLLAGDMVVIYQLTANGVLKEKKVYDQKFFQMERIHIRNMFKAEKNELLFLDSRSGLIKVSYQNDQINMLKSPKLLYEQPGCYLMEGINNGDDLVLGCSLATQSFFLLKLKRSYNFVQPHYEPQQTIFTNEKIYDLTFVDNFIMSRIYSGVRMFWTSNKASLPYPFDYNHAGNIFLHNALQSKLKVINGQNVIFISTEDQIRKFELKIKHPYVWCYSSKQNTEQYILTYNLPCQNATPMMKICSSSESLVFTSWEHGQVKITTMLIPLILSILGFIVIAYIGMRIYKNYHGDIQRARLRYNSDNQFGI